MPWMRSYHERSSKMDVESVPPSCGSLRESSIYGVELRLMLDDDLHLQVLRLLQEDPELSQRQLAEALGISVGKTHYAVRALLDRGWVKARNFRRSGNRKAYLYTLTPKGLRQKTRLAYRLLQRKRAEHAALMAEIEQLRTEVKDVTVPLSSAAKINLTQ